MVGRGVRAGRVLTHSRGASTRSPPGRGSGDLPRELNSVDAVAREALTVGMPAWLADGATARLSAKRQELGESGHSLYLGGSVRFPRDNAFSNVALTD